MRRPLDFATRRPGDGLAETLQHFPESRPAHEAQFPPGLARVIDAVDGVEHRPAAPGIELAIVREVARHHRRRVAISVAAVGRRERRHGRDDEGVEADLLRLGQRHDMGIGCVLDGEPAEQELVGLGVLARLDDGVRHVVFLGEEARGAQDQDRQLVQMVEQPAQLLGGALGDAVDVARLERRERLVDPDRLPGAARPAVADLLRDHQRGGRGEDEAVDLRARRHRLLEEVERALHVHRHELRIVVGLDMRLVARRGMDDGLDAMLAERCDAPARDRPPSRRSPWSGPARGRARRPGGRRAQAAAPGSGRASPTNPSPGCSSPIRPPLLPLQRRPAHRSWRRGCAPSPTMASWRRASHFGSL